MPTLASPLAFEICDGLCGDPRPTADNKHVSCPTGTTCTGECYCQLFHRKKGVADTEPWHLATMDKNKLSKHRPDKQDYKCFCIKPILEDELTAQDGTKYTVRYVLCTDPGACSLDAVEVVDQLNKQKYPAFKCSGDCKDNCKCTLFRLKVGGPNFDPTKAKWERLAKADTTVRFEDHSTYRCFCLK